jgi:diadenosine tetraphosphatase ApaH/serine/threonine PP2A family protein phosphatase
MRYAIFTDIHANLEALEAVLTKIDELATEKPIDQIWFLGDLVGYGPNPNECIDILRARTDVIIAGNHDWAAVGKLDLDDFSAAARISAEWTAEQLTEEHREFLRNLPLRLEKGECTLVHGSPYGPLWEYLTSEILAERSFHYFNTRFCVVGHTHVPVIFQQADSLVNDPTKPLDAPTEELTVDLNEEKTGDYDPNEEETAEMAAVVLISQKVQTIENAIAETEKDSPVQAEQAHTPTELASAEQTDTQPLLDEPEPTENAETEPLPDEPQESDTQNTETSMDENETEELQEEEVNVELVSYEIMSKTSSEDEIEHAKGHLNDEIEELLELLGLSQSMVNVTNEMLAPPEGHWEPPTDHRAIINPGGVGQPRDGDPRAAFMIYDSEQGTFDFYRIPYPLEKTQEKIIEVGLPQYLAVRLAYGR